MTSRPRIKREDFVVTVSEFRSYITSNDKWVSEEIPSEFFGADYEEYVDVEIESAKRSMSVWSDEAHSHHYNDGYYHHLSQCQELLGSIFESRAW